jgi:hypothetical protein
MRGMKETTATRKESPLRGSVGQGRRLPIAALIALAVRSQRRTANPRAGEKRSWRKEIA